MVIKEVEIPVVSEELARRFEELKEDNLNEPASDACKGYCYDGTKEYNENSNLNLEKLLMRMYLVGYEIENPERYVILLLKNKEYAFYLTKEHSLGSTIHVLGKNDSCKSIFNYSDGFTKKEIDNDSYLKELSKVCACIPFNKE